MGTDTTNKEEDYFKPNKNSVQWRIGQIKRLVLCNIGGHELIDTTFSPGINFITGGNGSGKSSLVSGIALLCGWNGKKAGKDANITKYIRAGVNKGTIRIHFSNNDENQDGYYQDVFGDEIIVERSIYLRGTSNYIFKGSKLSSPIYKSHEAKVHLSQFREFSNIIINNPITYLTQIDAKYLIREQSSPKSLYDFFQRSHLFDCSWKNLSEERLHLEKAEALSNDIRNEINIMEKQLFDIKNFLDLLEKYEELSIHEKNLNNITLLISILELSSSIENLKLRKRKLEDEDSKIDIEEINSTLLSLNQQESDLKEKLGLVKNDYENKVKEYKVLKQKHDNVSLDLTIFTNKKNQIENEIFKIKELITLKEKNIINSNTNNSIENKLKIFQEEKKYYEQKISFVKKEKEKFLDDISTLKNKIVLLKSHIEENNKEREILLAEEKENKEKKENLLKETENNKNLLKSILFNLKEIENFDKFSRNEIDIKEEKFSSTKNKADLMDYYNVYDYYLDQEFESAFGYTKKIHSTIISEIKNKYSDFSIFGPILLHFFVEASLIGNQKLINILDEILGGKLELEEFNIKIRRNYKYWIVNNSNARNILIKLFKEMNIDFDPTLIYIRSSFGQKRYDLSSIKSKYPKKGLALIDLINVKHDEVFNFLVDNFQIETTFVFSNDDDMELIYDYKYNIRKAYSLSSNSFRYRRGGIVVAPEIHTNIKIKCSDILLKFENNYSDDNKIRSITENNSALSYKERYKKYLDQSKFIEGSLKTNADLIKNLDGANSIIKNKYEILKNEKLELTQNLSKFENEISIIESELFKFEKQEHSVQMKIDEINIEIRKIDKEQFQNNDNLVSEIRSLNIQMESWEKKLDEIKDLILEKSKEQEFQKNKIEEMNKILGFAEDSLNKILSEDRSLVDKKSFLLEKIPHLQKRKKELLDELHRVDVELKTKDEEIKILKNKYYEVNNISNAIDERDEEISLFMQELNPTLKYFCHSFDSFDSEKIVCPSMSSINSWKNELKKKKDILHLDIIKQAKNIGIKDSEDIETILNKEWKEKTFFEYENKKNFIERKKNELEEEKHLLLMNKNSLNKRIQQLQENHINCAKNVNLNFKYYFSLFWSKTMKPHLKFDHNNSTLDIYVIPDAATVKKNGEQINDYTKKTSEINKISSTDYINREIQSLSGGESSSIGISLLLALSQSNSSPFHLFDEPDVYMDDIRRVTMIQSLVEFQKLCSQGKDAKSRQILIVTPHNEIIPYIKENYIESIHIIQLFKKC